MKNGSRGTKKTVVISSMDVQSSAAMELQSSLSLSLLQPIVYKRKRFRHSANKAVCVADTTKAKKSSHTRKAKYMPNPNPYFAGRAIADIATSCIVPQKAGWGTFRVGTSGYVYQHWKKIVYPEGMPQNQWFHLYAKAFDTVEINNTFYRLPAHQVFEKWRSEAPQGFSYALKFSRYGTHMKRLKDPEGSISMFVERAKILGQSMIGPILVQLPPKFDLYIDRLREFLQLAPPEFRWAIEVRDPRWLCDDVYSLLRTHNVPLCIHDHEDIPFAHPKVVTANWVYLRFHGSNYQQCYKLEQLQEEALLVRKYIERGIDVYAYFNNDYCGYAAFNALDFKKFVLQTLQA